MANNNNNMDEIFSSITEVLSGINLDNISAESSGNDLDDGYYLCEVSKAEITTSKTKGTPMVAFTFTVVENGSAVDVDENGEITKTEIKSTKGRKIFIYYPLSDSRSASRFISDMLKFEGEEPGTPILGREYFTNAEFLAEALSILVGLQVYIMVSTGKDRDGKDTTWKNLVSWKRADQIGLLD